MIRGSYQQNGTAPPVRIGSARRGHRPRRLQPEQQHFRNRHGLAADRRADPRSEPVHEPDLRAQPGRRAAAVRRHGDQLCLQPAGDGGILGVSVLQADLADAFRVFRRHDEFPGTGAPGPYAVTGTASVTTNATNNRVGATFTGSDPFGGASATLSINSAASPAPPVRAAPLWTTLDLARGRSRHAVAGRYVNIQLNGDPTQASKVAGDLGHGAVEQPVPPAAVQFLSVSAMGLLDRHAQYARFSRHRGRPPGRSPHQHLGRGHTERDIAGTGVGTFSGNALGAV